MYGETSSEATDWALKYDACGLFNRDYAGDIPIVRLVKPETRKEVQVDGQIRMEWL